MRTIIAVFIASMVSAVEIATWLAIRGYVGSTRTPSESDVLSTAFGLALFFSLILSLFVGLPAFYGFKRLGLFNVWTSSFTGTAIGCLGNWLIPDVPFLDGNQLSANELLTQYLVFGGCGLFSGFCFWLVRRSWKTSNEN